MTKSFTIYLAYAGEGQLSAGLSWVSSFKKFLELVLGQMTGQKPEVILLSDIAVRDFATPSALVCITNEAFTQSAACQENLKKYSQLQISGREGMRVFKVMRTPVPFGQQPLLLRDLMSYSLYRQLANGQTEQFEDFFEPASGTSYWLTMTDLCFDLYNYALRFQDGHVVEDRFVYLADTGADTLEEYNTIRRELQRYGYKTLPDRDLPVEDRDLSEQIRRDLEKSSMAIWIVGHVEGMLLRQPGTNSQQIGSSLAEYQYQVAETLNREREATNQDILPCRVWIKPGLQETQADRQKRFVQHLQLDSDNQKGIEIIQSHLEDFKSSILHAVSAHLRDWIREEAAQVMQRKTVYLMADRRDHKLAQVAASWLREQGYELLWPGEEATKRRLQHREFLATCDATLICFDSAKESWLWSQLSELLKAPGLGRAKRPLQKVILGNFGDGSIAQKISTLHQDAVLLRRLEDLPQL